MSHTNSEVRQYYYTSPVGKIIMAATGKGICKLFFADDNTTYDSGDNEASGSSHPLVLQLVRELDNYFSGNLKSFSVPLDPRGTDFQKKVWSAVAQVPYGEVLSYTRLSSNLNDPLAIRAIANANARNPLLILIPCHRIIGANGDLTGYAAGLPRKKFLLELEGSLEISRQMSLQF